MIHSQTKIMIAPESISATPFRTIPEKQGTKYPSGLFKKLMVNIDLDVETKESEARAEAWFPCSMKRK